MTLWQLHRNCPRTLDCVRTFSAALARGSLPHAGSPCWFALCGHTIRFPSYIDLPNFCLWEISLYQRSLCPKSRQSFQDYLDAATFFIDLELEMGRSVSAANSLHCQNHPCYFFTIVFQYSSWNSKRPGSSPELNSKLYVCLCRQQAKLSFWYPYAYLIGD